MSTVTVLVCVLLQVLPAAAENDGRACLIPLRFVQNYSYDPLLQPADLPPELTFDQEQATVDGRCYCIIQFHGPIRPEQKHAVEQAGAELLWYIPDYAFVGRIPLDRIAVVRNRPEVRWLGPDQPAFKFCPGLDRLALSAGRSGLDFPLRLIVVFFPNEDAVSLLRQINALGATDIATSFNRWNQSIRITLPASRLIDLARLPGVFWIEPYGELTPDNQDVQWVDQHGYSASDTTRTIWRRGLTGRRVLVGITDTPLWLGHDLFRDPTNNTPGPNHRKIVRYVGTQGADVHGTHTVGTLCGNDAPVGGSSWHDGLACDARAYFQNYEALSGNWDMNNWFAGPDSGLNIAVDSLRALNHSMSLSRKDTFNIYIFTDMTADQFVWNHRRFLHCNSMGNYGNNTMGHPVIAKNIISTGGTRNGTACRSIYTASSRGPTADGRRKPQLVAPGENVYSASNTSASDYVALSGTSMATPNMTAATALIREYFRKGFYPTGDTTTGTPMEITAALNKAVAIVGADNDITGYTVPDNNIGWGRIDLDSSLYFAGDSSRLWVFDDTVGLTTGDSALFPITVNSSSRPLRVALCWTDYPGTMRAARILVNDLDLVLVSPAGTEYKGNVWSGGQSQTGGSHDSLNVEECCRINAPAVGTWTVKVRARHTPQGPQPYALAVIGGLGTGAGSDVGVTRIIAPVGIIDSTQNITPACSTWNWGTQTVSYSVLMRIGSGYSQLVTVNGHTPGTARLVQFPPAAAWPRGTLDVSCSTRLAGDVNPDNNRRYDSCFVRVLDVGIRRLLLPSAGIDSGTVFTPACTLFNRGNVAASYPVRLTIGTFYDRTTPVVAHSPGTLHFLPFPPCTARLRGGHPVVCSTRLGGDMDNSNDRASGMLVVDVGDVSVSAIIAPSGTVDSCTVVTPACSLRNNGTVNASCLVRMRIGAGYEQTTAVNNLPPGAATLVSFPQWQAEIRGQLTAACSVAFSLDRIPANDTMSRPVFVRVLDASALAIIAPTGTVAPGERITPRVRVRNLGNAVVSFPTLLRIGAEYTDTRTVNGLPPGAETELAFSVWTVLSGTRTVLCSVGLAGDMVPANDTISRRVTGARTGWVELASIPGLPSGKPVKDGGAIAFDPSGERCFVLKGNKTGDCYLGRPGSFTALPLVPPGGSARLPGKGAAVCAGDDGTFYLVKGNNTAEFWRFASDVWTRLADIPLGTSGKKPKGGTDICFVPDSGGWVYLLKGGTAEFMRYSVAGSSWQILADAPAGIRPRYDNGSWLTLDQDRRRLLCHKARYHELYTWNLSTGTWTSLPVGMPLFCSQTGRLKRSRDGSDGIVLGDRLWAIKGANTPDFYSLDLNSLQWYEQETIPSVGSTGRRKRVKGGGSITTDGNVIFALKGNKTLELWQYTPAAEPDKPTDLLPARQTLSSDPAQPPATELRIPTHIRRHTPIRLRIESATRPAQLTVCDASGRLILARSVSPSARQTVVLPGLPPGVYLLRFTGGPEAKYKLVIE